MRNGLLALAFAIPAFSTAAQPQPPARSQMYVVHEEVARLSMIPEFEAATRELFTAFAEQKADPAVLGIHVYMTTDFHYYFISPISNFAGLDRMREAWKSVAGGVGGKRWDEINAHGGRTLSSFNQFVIVQRPDLSYVPAVPRLKPEERRFEHWMFYYFQPGKEDEAESILRDYVALFRKKNVADGFTVFTVPVGHDLPLMIISNSAKSAADHAEADEKLLAALAADIGPLQMRALAITRRAEAHDAYVRPDLSYPLPPVAAPR
jgi:hypothetical protein